MKETYDYEHFSPAWDNFYVQECDGYEEWLPALESLELKTAFFSNATKNKHDKDCGAPFDVAILIKTLWHIFWF